MTNRKSFEIFRHLWIFFEASDQIFWSDERDVTHFQKILRNIRLSCVTVTPQWRHSGITKAPQWRHKGRHNDNSLITMTSQWHLSIPKMLQRKIHDFIVASQAQLNDIIVASKNSQDVANEISWSHSCVTGTTQWHHRRHICITMISCIEAAEELGNSGIQN